MSINREPATIITLHFEEEFGDGGGYSWKSPDFKRGFIDELKETIPAEDRTYDPVNQIWTVACEHVSEVESMLEEWFKADVVYDETGFGR